MIGQKRSLTLNRRSFLAGSVAGGLVMGFGGLGASGSARAELAGKRFSPAVWFEMDEKGITTVNIAKAEMGQHVGTALARIVAEELGVDWNDVRLAHVDSDPRWGYMVTGGSWSVWSSFSMLSQAGAAGRQVLTEAGAALLGVDAGNCQVGNSRVVCGDKSISFAEIVQKGDIDRAFSEDELKAMPIKAATDRELIGQAVMALDVPAKSAGMARYGIDAEVEGMVYARPLIPPTRYGSTVNGVDDSAAKGIRGYLGYQVLNDPSGTLQGWVTAVADNQWSAIKAADAIQVDWTPGPTASVSEQDLVKEGLRAANDPSEGALVVNDGDVTAARAGAASNIQATYKTAPVLHFPLEPMNATAEFKDGVWNMHSGNQWQSLIIPVLANALEVEESQVVLRQYYLGGGFGRRLFGDYILPAALTAKAIGKPVKVVFTREDDSRFDCIRSTSVSKFMASIDGDNALTGIDHAAAAGWPTLTMAPGFMGDGVDGKGKFDPFSISGSDHWYTLANHRVRGVNNRLAQETFLPGWLRSVGTGWVTFGVESFMDEIAHHTSSDPVAFRLAMLDGAGKQAGEAPNSVGGAKRLANVLERLREAAGWGKPQSENEGLGVAISYGQERNMPTWTACAVKVRVDPASGAVKVTDIWQQIDCGTVIDPSGAMAQAEGATLWGLSMALFEGTAIENGQVKDTNLDSYSPLRLKDVPNLHIELVDSDEIPVGMGEPAVTVVAPAIANAIYNAVGARVRELPITAAAVKAAI